MPKNYRFITSSNLEPEEVSYGTNEWMCRAGLCDAEKLMLCRVPVPVGEGHNFHRHPELEEIIYVIEGQAEQWVDREKRILCAGELAHIPTDVVHATFNAGEETLLILAILSPAVHQGPFLIEMHEEEPWRDLRGEQ